MALEDRINNAIGKQYDYEKYHCWDLVLELRPDLPTLEGQAKNISVSVRQFKEHFPEFVEAKREPVNGDLIVLGKKNSYFHAGIYYNGGVVHADAHQVLWHSMNTITGCYQNLKIMEHR